MKNINYQCLYTVDDSKFFYTAFDHDGRLFGFENAPVRDFNNLEWVDSVTGEPGELIPFDRWDVSMREPVDMADFRTPHLRKGTKLKSISTAGKKGVKDNE
jgi:hypothetical protein